MTVPAEVDPDNPALPSLEGSSGGAAFTPQDWVLLVIPAVIWGSSFLLIAEGLEAFRPGVVTWLRIAFGALALGLLKASRQPIDPADRGRIALIGVVWIAFPMTMFPIAEQWISTSVTGMLNGSMPLFSATVASLLLRRLPGRTQIVGLAVGFAGVVAISLPSLQGGSNTALGAGLVVLAMCSYGVATNLVIPLQQRYGTLPVIWRAQLTALVLTTPFALVGLPDSHMALRPMLAMVVLGAVGTGYAFIAAGTLMGRVGATRGSVLAYLIPVVSLLLGVVLRNETVAAVSIAGLVLVLAGAWLVSRAATRR